MILYPHQGADGFSWAGVVEVKWSGRNRELLVSNNKKKLQNLKAAHGEKNIVNASRAAVKRLGIGWPQEFVYLFFGELCSLLGMKT